METGKRPGLDWPIYVRSLLAVSAVISVAVLVQVFYIYGEFHPRFIIVPSAVTLIVGLLVGRLAVLRKRLRQKTEAFRAIVDIAQEFTYLRTVDGRYEYVSPSCERLTGYPPEAFYETDNLMDYLIHPEDRHRWTDHIHHINSRGKPESFDIRLLNKQGETVWITHICAPVFDEKGRQTGVRSTNLDITQRKRDQFRIERLAHYDPLTDLPNRRLLEQNIRERVEAEERFAVLFLDLSRFKNINDSLGHSLGDRLLQKIARRLDDLCPEEVLLCRFGGDEFVMVHGGLTGNEAARQFAGGVLDAIEQPVMLGSNELHISGTIGIAFCPEDGTDTETLVRNADAAMYRAKRSGRNRISEYHATYSAEAAHFVSTESDIYRALRENEFLPHYQAKVDLESGAIVGLEALARWQHPTQGLVAPGQFIGVAEETGQIAELGEQILSRVLEDMAGWRRLGLDLPVAINISPRQFSDNEFWQHFKREVEAAAAPPRSIELEITEQVFLGDVDSTAERLGKLRADGFQIALDDFGTGYSSFDYLRRLPISTIKLDRAFVSDLERERLSQAILRALVGLCSDLGLTLIPEGIETETQRSILLDFGCRIGQGFLFHRPQPADEIETVMKAHRLGSTAN